MNATARVKVLIADGDSKLRELIRTNLSDEAFEVSEAATAWDCVKAACREQPDLLILDLDLPDHHGWETLSLMKLTGVLAHIGVILTSAEIPSPTTLRRFPAADFIRKPIDARHLLQRVERAIAERRAEAHRIADCRSRLAKRGGHGGCPGGNLPSRGAATPNRRSALQNPQVPGGEA